MISSSLFKTSNLLGRLPRWGDSTSIVIMALPKLKAYATVSFAK